MIDQPTTINGYKVSDYANAYPMMPAEPFAALVSDIQVNGLREPVLIWRGELIDGRHRALAATKAGVKLRVREVSDKEVGNPVVFVRSMNTHRRHLTAPQRKVVEDALREMMSQSNRAIAKATGSTHTTVAKVRREMESIGKLATSEKRVSLNGKVQPATKARATSMPWPSLPVAPCH